MAIIKIDGFDLYSYTRTAPGEGLDLADTDFLEPQFGDSAVGAGNPLLSVKQENREITVPIHLKSSDKTKDTLHSQLVDLNYRLSQAKVLEWKDDGATNTSYLSIEFARFEPEFNKRRQDAGWMSGIVRIFTRPFSRRASAGYFTNWTSSQGVTGIVGSIAVVAYTGDAPGKFQFSMTAPSVFPLSDGRIFGAALVPSGYVVDWSAASLITLNGATLMGWPGAAGSQVVAQVDKNSTDIARVIITNASAYNGRNRVLAVAAMDRPNRGLSLYADDGTRGPIAYASVHGMIAGFNTLDLGVVNIDPALSATKVLTFTQINTYDSRVSAPGFSQTNRSNCARINRIILLPEDTTVLNVDTNRRLLAGHGLTGNYGAVAATLSIDEIGNQYAGVTRYASYALAVPGVIGGVQETGLWVATTGGAGIQSAPGGMEVQIPTVYDYSAMMTFGLDAAETGSYNAAVIGKFAFDGSSRALIGARVANQNVPSFTSQPTQAVFQIVLGDPGLNNAASVAAIACQIINLPDVGSVSANFTNDFEVKVWQRGPAIDARLTYGLNGSYVATLSASHALANIPGTGFVGMRATTDVSTGFGGQQIYRYSISAQPSTGHLPGDVYTLNSETGKNIRGIAQNFSLDRGMRGVIPQRAVPSKYGAAVVLNLPLDGGPTNQSWSFGVAENEYFTYSVT